MPNLTKDFKLSYKLEHRPRNKNEEEREGSNHNLTTAARLPNHYHYQLSGKLVSAEAKLPTKRKETESTVNRGSALRWRTGGETWETCDFQTEIAWLFLVRKRREVVISYVFEHLESGFTFLVGDDCVCVYFMYYAILSLEDLFFFSFFFSSFFFSHIGIFFFMTTNFGKFIIKWNILLIFFIIIKFLKN